jgi:hypothetical protein
LVGAIGFEPNPLHSFQPFAGLGWQPKDRNGSQLLRPYKLRDILNAADDVENLAILTKDRRIDRTPVPFLKSTSVGLQSP